MIEIHNGIIAACTRNAQSKKSIDIVANDVDHLKISTAQKTARLTLEERLAAVTKGKNSRLTVPSLPPRTPVAKIEEKPHPKDEDNALLIQQAFDKVSLLEDFISGRILKQDQNEATLIDSFKLCKQLHSTICSRIPQVVDPSQLGKLIVFNFLGISLKQ